MSKLKKARLEAGLSQSQLAKISDLKLRTIQSLESGARDINKTQAGNVYKLSKFLNCTMEELLEQDD